jgi:putative hydrolase of the HAD superfamily
MSDITRKDDPATFRALRDAESWVFDLDNTLYPSACRLFAEVGDRIRQYVATALDLSHDEAHNLQKQYLVEYGTTLYGMMSVHGTDPRDYLDYVHDINLAPVQPAPDLNAALGRLTGRKLIFTNADTSHAERVLDRLGITHHFEAIFDVVAGGYVPKPAPAVYDAMVQRFDVTPSRSVMVEDMARNLVPAAALGMTTVWVRTDLDWHGDGDTGDHVHHVTDNLTGWLCNVVDAS